MHRQISVVFANAFSFFFFELELTHNKQTLRNTTPVDLAQNDTYQSNFIPSHSQKLITVQKIPIF